MKYSGYVLLDKYNTHTLQISMHHMTGVEVVETLSHVQELRGSQSR